MNTSAQRAPKRACVHTLGCRLNQSETTLLEEKLQAAGYDLVPFGQPADLAIVNTCTVTHDADSKSRKLIRQFIRKNPEAYTAVIGCYAQMGASALAKIEGVDLIIGNQEKLNVLDYVAAGRNASPLVVRDRIGKDDFSIVLAEEASPLDRRANLKVQDGCDFMCSFCIIPFARGRARSRSLPNLLEEARQLVERGGRELILTGVNIGTYGWEEFALLDVVDALNGIDGLERLRISSIEPTTIAVELFARMADSGHVLLPYLHIPLQSGSNRILAAMRRRYTREEFVEFVFQAHEAVPGIGIGTDILVGFPGESEADFEDTCDVLWRSPLFYAHVFKYSEREGTASVRMGGKISPDAASARSARLRKLSGEKTRLFHESHVGQTVRVLFESNGEGYWTGFSESYCRVAVRSDAALKNEVREVHCTEVRGDVIYGECC